MRMGRKAMLAAGLLAGAAAMTGCTANTRPAATSTPQAAQQQTAQPATAQPATAQPATAQPTAQPTAGMEAAAGTDAEAQAETAEMPEPLPLLVDGKETDAGAAMENERLLLPLIETAEALGWTADSKETEEETQTRHEIALEKEKSRITVSYEVSDNTIRRISWQKDGLLVPVDTLVRRIGQTVYVPAAFFEEAMGVKVTPKGNSVEVSSPEPMDTPQTNQ